MKLSRILAVGFVRLTTNDVGAFLIGVMCIIAACLIGGLLGGCAGDGYVLPAPKH